jgi:hypothetical protein
MYALNGQSCVQYIDGPPNANYSHHRTATIPQTTLQAQHVQKAASDLNARCRCDNSFLRRFIICVFRAARRRYYFGDVLGPAAHRLADYAARSWKVQWWLLDGWMALLYLAAFSTIIYLWRPSTGNGR